MKKHAMTRNTLRQYISVLPFYTLALLVTGTIFYSCKDENNSEAVERERQRADSIMKASLENQKRLETEEELAERVRRIKNKSIITGDTVFYESRVSERPDFLLSVIELSGKSNTGGKIATFTSTALSFDGKIVPGTIPGNLFRHDHVPGEAYSLYTIDDTTGEVHTFRLETSNDSLYLHPATSNVNYYFDLLRQDSFTYQLDNEDRFFKTIKGARITNTYVSDSVLKGKEVYTDSNNLFPEHTTAPFLRMWIRSERNTKNTLLTQTGDSTFQFTTLSGKRSSPGVTELTSSAFINDSVFMQYKVRDSLVYDHPHLVVYRKDSVSNTYGYNKNFRFQLKTTDTTISKQNYPQKYPQLQDSLFEIRSQTFNVNNRDAFWRYVLRYDLAKGGQPGVRVRVSNKDLMDATNNTLIFRLPKAGTPERSNLADLLAREDIFPGKDLNFDGFKDLSFVKGTDNNNNPLYMVYLWEEQYGRFSRTSRLDGASVLNGIVRDTLNKRLLYPGYIGQGHLSVSVISPESALENNKEIYWTTGNINTPLVHYQKIENNRITDKRSPLLDSLPVTGGDLKNSLISWILQQGSSLSEKGS